MCPNIIAKHLHMTAMSVPRCCGAGAVRTEKTKVLEAVRPFGPDDARRNIVRAQYGSGAVDGKSVDPYRRAANAASQSVTETYVALQLAVANQRCADVPFCLRTG